MHTKLNVIDGNITDDIPRFFAGKNLLITGSTGFMGKVLLQKLLSDCPDVGTLYLLIRNGKNTAEVKLEKVLENRLFDGLKREKPHVFAKLQIVEGDLTQLGLGLRADVRSKLVEEVDVVYHVAASVRFNMPLHEAIILNVRGTREVCKLVLEMKNVRTFLHISTGYCHVDKPVIEEKVYPPNCSWKEAVEIAENFDEELLKIIQCKYIGALPNSYTFTKSLAENLVVDLCEGKIPTIIMRPTIVMPAYKGAIPGWTDSFNGPLGIMIGMNVGVIRAIYLKNMVQYDYIPVDETINSMIKAVWMQQYLLGDQVSIYNSSINNVHEVNTNMLMDIGRESMDTIVLKPFWHANLYTSTSELMVYLHVILFHVFPLALVDLFQKITTGKTKFVKLQRRVYLAIKAYQYFLINSWKFENDKCLALDGHLCETDRKLFCHDLHEIDYRQYFFTMAHTARLLLLKEDPKDQPIYKRRRILYRCIHVGLKYLFLYIFARIVYRLFFERYFNELFFN